MHTFWRDPISFSVRLEKGKLRYFVICENMRRSAPKRLRQKDRLHLYSNIFALPLFANKTETEIVDLLNINLVNALFGEFLVYVGRYVYNYKEFRKFIVDS